MKAMVSDFSGGLTDSSSTSPDNCAEVIDNWIINKDRTIRGVPGVEVLDAASTSRLPTGKRVSRLARLSDGRYLAFSMARAFLIAPGSITELLGPTGNVAFNAGTDMHQVSIESGNDVFLCTNSARATPIKIFLNENGVAQLRTAGLPRIGLPSLVYSAGVRNVLFALVYYVEYRVGNVLFVDIGSPGIVSAPSSAQTVSMTNIPVLSNAGGMNYDTANVKVQIYRTVDAGSTFYYDGEVTNGTTTYVSTLSDALIALRSPLYTTGGVRDNDAPPKSEFVFEANDTYYWCNVVQEGEHVPYRALQSQTGDADSVPSDFSVNVKGALKGGAAIGRSPLLFTESSITRLDGILDETGRGAPNRETISTTVGTLAHGSIVRGATGVYFAGPDAFYFTTGFGTPTKIAKLDPFRSKIDRYYQAWTATPDQRARIQGAYDSKNNRVYWTIQSLEADNDVILVYSETHDSFTTMSNEVGIMPTALLMDGQDIIAGDSNGFLFRYSDDYFTHPVVETGVPVGSWKVDTIKYRWKSVQFTAGDASVNKWGTKINVQGNPGTNINMAIRSYTNGEPEAKDLFPLRLAPVLTWGDPAFIWGNEAFVWNRTSTMNQTRNMPRGRLRFRQRQIEFTNAYYTVMASTVQPASRVSISGSLVTLVTPSSYSFGLNNEHYDLWVAGISYPILSGTADTLVVQGTPPSGIHTWAIKGYGKGQRPHVLNFSLDYEPMSDAGTWWRGSEEA